MPVELPPKTKIIPSDESVLCRMYEHTGEREHSNIIIPEAAREEVFFAHIEAIGPGKKYDMDVETGEVARFPVDYKPGDDIIFIRFRGERLLIGDRLHVLMRIDDILAKLELPDEKDGKFFYKFAGKESQTAEILKAAASKE